LSFLISCPNCGPRSVYEFQSGSEYQRRPSGDAPDREWVGYLYFRKNSAGEQLEWWYHSSGCRLWFLACRDTSTNRVIETFWPEELKKRGLAADAGTSE
jgi:sarcosine oxidase subunit delta